MASETAQLVINPVETPATIRPVYDAIQNDNTTDTEITEHTGLEQYHADQGIAALHAAGLIESHDEPYETHELSYPEIDEWSNFRLTLLQGFMQDYVPDDWGRQAVVHLHYEYLIRHQANYISDDGDLWKEVRSWEEERGYIPIRDNGDPYKFNMKKWKHWTALARYLGLLRKTQKGYYTVYIDPNLIRASLEVYRAKVDQDSFAFDEYWEWVQDTFFRVTQQDGQVPAPLSQSLHRLLRNGEIEFTKDGDAGAIKLAQVDRHRIESQANTVMMVTNE